MFKIMTGPSWIPHYVPNVFPAYEGGPVKRRLPLYLGNGWTPAIAAATAGATYTWSLTAR